MRLQFGNREKAVCLNKWKHIHKMSQLRHGDPCHIGHAEHPNKINIQSSHQSKQVLLSEQNDPRVHGNI